MKEQLDKEYNKLHDLEKKYALSLDELEQYKEIKRNIKEIRRRIDNDLL